MGRLRLVRRHIANDPTRADLWVTNKSLRDRGTVLRVSEEQATTTLVGRSLTKGRTSNEDGSYSVPVEKRSS